MDAIFHEGPDDRQLFDEQERIMETSEVKWTISEPADKLFEALSKAQGGISNAAKDAANPFFKSKYADLASVWGACRGPLSENGLCVIQIPSSEGQLVSVVTILGHSSGQKMSCELSATAKAADPQSVGSVLTYLRRYSLSSVAGIAPEDDDGNAGTGKPEEHRQSQRQETSQGDRREFKRQQASGEENQTTAAPKDAPPKDSEEFLLLCNSLIGMGVPKGNREHASAVCEYAANHTLDDCRRTPSIADRVIENLTRMTEETSFAEVYAKALTAKGIAALREPAGASA